MWTVPPTVYPRRLARFSVSAVIPCPANAASPCIRIGSTLVLAIATQARLLGARASQRHWIDSFQMAGIGHHVNAHLAAAGPGVDAGRTDVILHVAAAQHAARIDILKSGKDLRRRPAHDVDDDVQASAMAHGQHRLLGAISGRGVQNLVQQRNQRGVAFQRIALGADVARVDRLLEDIGAHQLIQNARAIDMLLLRRLHALLDPLPSLRIGDVHELHADAAAVDAAGRVGNIARTYPARDELAE